MAEQLEEFPFNRRDRGDTRWDEYLDGNVWKLSLEETEMTTVATLRSSMNHAAHSKGLELRTTKVDDDHLVVQTYTRKDDDGQER